MTFDKAKEAVTEKAKDIAIEKTKDMAVDKAKDTAHRAIDTVQKAMDSAQEATTGLSKEDVKRLGTVGTQRVASDTFRAGAYGAMWGALFGAGGAGLLSWMRPSVPSLDRYMFSHRRLPTLLVAASTALGGYLAMRDKQQITADAAHRLRNVSK